MDKRLTNEQVTDASRLWYPRSQDKICTGCVREAPQFPHGTRTTRAREAQDRRRREHKRRDWTGMAAVPAGSWVARQPLAGDGGSESGGSSMNLMGKLGSRGQHEAKTDASVEKSIVSNAGEYIKLHKVGPFLAPRLRHKLRFCLLPWLVKKVLLHVMPCEMPHPFLNRRCSPLVGPRRRHGYAPRANRSGCDIMCCPRPGQTRQTVETSHVHAGGAP